MALTCLVGWPLVGFMVGSVTGDPTAWHRDPQVVRLCTQPDLAAGAPCLLRRARAGADLARGPRRPIDADTDGRRARRRKVAMGWPLQIAALAGDGLAARPQPHPGGRRLEAEPA